MSDRTSSQVKQPSITFRSKVPNGQSPDLNPHLTIFCKNLGGEESSPSSRFRPGITPSDVTPDRSQNKTTKRIRLIQRSGWGRSQRPLKRINAKQYRRTFTVQRKYVRESSKVYLDSPTRLSCTFCSRSVHCVLPQAITTQRSEVVPAVQKPLVSD